LRFGSAAGTARSHHGSPIIGVINDDRFRVHVVCPFRFCPAPSAFPHRSGPLRYNKGVNRSSYCFEFAESPLETGHGYLTAPRIYECTRTNKIPFRRFGKHIRFTDEDLDAIIASGASPTNGDEEGD